MLSGSLSVTMYHFWASVSFILESFQLHVGFSFPFLRANDLRSSLLNIRARSFNSLVHRRYIHKVSVQLVQTYFSRVCSTDGISCSERKNWKKTRLKQRSKTKEVKSKRCCRRQFTWLIISLLSLRYCSAVAPISLCYRSVVAPLSHRYCTAIVPLSLRRCRSVVALLSHHYRTCIAPLSLRCCRSCCCYAVTPILRRYCSTVALLLSLLLLLHSRTAITPVSLHCLSAAVATQSYRYRTGIAPLSL